MINTLARSLVYLAVAAGLLISMAWPALADAVVLGHVTATANTEEPDMGAWKYCLDLVWDTGSDVALTYFDLVLGLELCDCVCEDFLFSAFDPVGETTAGLPLPTPPCTVYYTAEFLCLGDDAISLPVPLIQFAPIDEGCVPEATGHGTVCFYSDWAPVEVATPNEYLIIKAGDEVIFGEITGELPGCECPSPAECDSWGKIKTQFR
jgi:hypothetical protein